MQGDDQQGQANCDTWGARPFPLPHAQHTGAPGCKRFYRRNEAITSV